MDVHGVDALSARLRIAWRAGERFAIRAPLCFSMLAVLALLATAYLLLRPSYDTNDDVFMTMIVAGRGLSSTPDEHLIFTNVLIGRALSWLYTVGPRIPWYGIYLLLVHYLAQVATLYCALTAADDSPRLLAGQTDGSRLPTRAALRDLRTRFAWYVVYFAAVGLVLLNHLQYTTTAFLAAQAGIFLLWLAARRRAQTADTLPVGPLCCAVLLLVVAGLIRLESLGMAALVAAPLAVMLFRRSALETLWPSAMAAAVSATVLLLASSHDRAAYEHDPRWRGFFSYNSSRCKFNDYQWTSYTPQTAEIFSAVGWSENDHAMIANWYFDDPELYSEARLRYVLESYPWKTARLSAGYVGKVVRKLLQDRAVWAVLLVLPFFLVRLGHGSEARRAVLACAGVALAVCLVVILNNKVPPMRIYFPLASLPLAVCLLFAGNAIPTPALRGRRDRAANWPLRAMANWRKQPRMVRTVVVLLVVGIVLGTYRQARRSAHVARDRRALQTFLADIPAADRHLYVCWEAALPFELVSPLDNLLAWKRIPLIALVWTQRTPWQEAVKQQFGITCLARALFERDDVVLVATPTHRALLATFAKEHCDADVEFVESRAFGRKFVAGRFRRKPPRDEKPGQEEIITQRPGRAGVIGQEQR